MHFNDTQESATEHASAPSRLTLLTLGLSGSLDDALLHAFRIIEAETADDALRQLAQEEVAVLILGSLLAPKVALSILGRYAADQPENSTSTIILCAGSEPELFQTDVNEGRVFYMARGDIAAEHLRLIAACGAARFRSRQKDAKDPWVRVARIDELLDFCIRLPMQADLPSAAGLLTATTRELINADLVQYLVYDAEDETLTPADALDNKEWSESAAAGLVAFVARTGEPIRLDCIGLDPRYDSEADNPGGPEDARFLAQPLIGPEGLPVGVITATRSGHSIPFSEEDARLLDLLAECAAPTLNQITLQNRVQKLMLKRAESSNSDVFREEALEHHIRSWDQQGEVLKTLPAWLRTTYWVMLALVVVGLLGTIVAKFNVYASGPAVIRAHATPASGYDLIAFLPNSYAAQLHPGMAICLRVPGESSQNCGLSVSSVGPEILGPAEAARYAGKEDAADFSVPGRVIVVRASLPVASSGSFPSVYRDGMTVEAEISVRSESAIVALIPGLRKIFGKAD
jgi:GAF domain-containing protein